MDKVSRALFLENRAVQVQAEREAAAKAVEAADKSNKASEKAFVTGSVKGVGAGIAEGAAWVIDVLMSNPKYQFGSEQLTSFETDLRTYFDSKMQDKTPAEREGFEFGNVLSIFTDPSVGIKAMGVLVGAKKAKKVLSKEEELAALIKEQASDQKGWQKMGGSKPPVEVRDEYAKQGLDYEGRRDPETGAKVREGELEPVYPARSGEKQESAFPSKQSEPVYEMQDEHPVLVGDKEDQQMLEYSQAQHDPGATAGLAPQEPAPSDSTLKNIWALAAARTKRWKGGKFDPVRAEKDWALELQKRKAAASKGSGAAAADRPAKYWVLDESDKTIYEVSLNKNGEVVTRRSNADWRLKDDKGNVVRDYSTLPDGTPSPNYGKPVARPEIDEIVPSGAREFIESKRDKLAVEEFQASQARLSPSPPPPRDMTKWDSDVADKPARTAATNLYDQMEAMQWDTMSPTEKRDFIENWLTKELLPDVPNLKKK